jgi:hopene-associated glycosyltransferase HpnB
MGGDDGGRTVVIIFGAVVVGIWVYLLGGRGWFWTMRVEAAPKRVGPAPRVCAVVPARNEAEGVGPAIGSLAKQRYDGEFHVVLVDDHSDDGTADLARAAAPGNRLTVVAAPPLERGWTGKLWAVNAGIREAERFDPEWLLLTDADIAHPPRNVEDLVARAEAGGHDLVSYMATLHCGNVAERALIPAFVFFFFMLYPPRWGTGAAGGCILIRRSMLERVGGIARIRGELIDDCSLAAAVRQAGGRVWLGLSPETRSIREYRGFGEIGRMISRTAFTQLRYSPWLLAGTVAGLALTYVAPVALTAAGVWWGAAAWALMTIAYFPATRFYRISPLWAAALPAVTVFYMGATMHSAVEHWRGRGGLWKGRTM